MSADVFGLVGTVVAGTYRVDEVVAEGGFGVVYRAYHNGFRAPVALKCLKIPERFGTAQQHAFLEQFREEAELMFRLSSSIPTVVRPLHIDALISPAGRFVPFIALEWLDGLTLDRVVEQRRAKGLGPPSLRKLVGLLTPVARALDRAHKFNGPDGPMAVTHRDVKPENVFIATVNGEQVPKILDFGIATARSVASQVGGAVTELATSFTPAFGAPEQWAPHKHGPTGPWTDVWGLALTLVEVSAGRPIVDGDAATMMTTVLDPRRRPTPRTEGLVVSDAVERVFARALALDPAERFPAAGEFWDALCDALDLQPAPAPHSRRDPRIDGGRSGSVDDVVGLDRISVAPAPAARPRVPPPLPPPAVPGRSTGGTAVTQSAGGAAAPRKGSTGPGALPPPAPPPPRAAPPPSAADIPDLDLGGGAPAPLPAAVTPGPPATAPTPPARPQTELDADVEGDAGPALALDLDLGPDDALRPGQAAVSGSTGRSSGSLAAVRPEASPGTGQAAGGRSSSASLAAVRPSSVSLAAVRPASTSGSHAVAPAGAITGSHAAVRATGGSGSMAAVSASQSGRYRAVGGEPGEDAPRLSGSFAAAPAAPVAVPTSGSLARELAPGGVLIALGLGAGVARAVSEDGPGWMKLAAIVGLVVGLGWVGWKLAARR